MEALIAFGFWLSVALVTGCATYVQYLDLQPTGTYALFIFPEFTVNYYYYLAGIALAVIGFLFLWKMYMRYRKEEIRELSGATKVWYYVVAVFGMILTFVAACVAILFSEALFLNFAGFGILSVFLIPGLAIAMMIKDLKL